MPKDDCGRSAGAYAFEPSPQRSGGGHGTAGKGTSSFFVGALDSLRWLTEGGPGPLTRRFTEKPVMVHAVAWEVAVADGKIYGKNPVDAEYARGVLHALMWAQYATSAPPVRLRPRVESRQPGQHREPRPAPVDSRRSVAGTSDLHRR